MDIIDTFHMNDRTQLYDAYDMYDERMCCISIYVLHTINIIHVTTSVVYV